jgi:hypothetical protein
MPIGHARTAAARVFPAISEVLPVRRGHSSLKRGSGAFRPASPRPSRGDRRQPHAPRELGRGKGHEAERPRRGRLEQVKKL